MMLTSLKIYLPGKHRKDVLEALCRFKRMTEISMGCLGCQINQDVENPNTVTYSEEWRTRQDLEMHLQSPNYRQVLEIIELSAHEPEIKFFSISKIEGLEVVKSVRISAGRHCRTSFFLEVIISQRQFIHTLFAHYLPFN